MPEIAVYEWRGQHILTIAYAGITDTELRAFHGSDVEFALHVEWPVATLMYRFGVDLPWSDSAFNVLAGGAIPTEDLASLGSRSACVGDQRRLMSLIFVDARTGIVRGLRVCTLSPAFSRALDAALDEQVAREPVSDERFSAAVGSLHRRFRNTHALLAQAQARTIGGF